MWIVSLNCQERVFLPMTRPIGSEQRNVHKVPEQRSEQYNAVFGKKTKLLRGV